MSKRVTFLLLLILLINAVPAANFVSGDKVRIKEVQNSDCYAAGSEIVCQRSVQGDLVACAGEIIIDDTIQGDLLATAGTININAPVGDDIRVAGGELIICDFVGGDVIVFGGSIRITELAEISGDIICFGGEISLYGHVKGNILVYGGVLRLNNRVDGNVEFRGGNVDFNGNVAGNMTLQAEKIEVGSDASCSGLINYWQKEGELEFPANCAQTQFDPGLAMDDKNGGWSTLAGLLGIGIITYWIIFILSVFLVLMLLEYYLNRQFIAVADEIKRSFISCFGYGMLYLLGIPVLILLSFIIIIGFPVGLVALSIYGLSLLYATAVIGLTLTHYFKSRSKQNWSYFQIVMYALLTVIIIKIIFFIPWLGTLLKTIAMATVYGAFLMLFVGRKYRKNQA